MDSASFVQLSAPVTVLRTPTPRVSTKIMNYQSTIASLYTTVVLSLPGRESNSLPDGIASLYTTVVLSSTQMYEYNLVSWHT